MTDSDEILQRAPQGWRKARNSMYYRWVPSDKSGFEPRKLNPEICVRPVETQIEGRTLMDEEPDFSDGAITFLRFRTWYVDEDSLPDDPDENVDRQEIEHDFVEFLDLDEPYTVKVVFSGLSKNEALRKAKSIMNEVKEGDDLEEYLEEKKDVMYGIDTPDLRQASLFRLSRDQDSDEHSRREFDPKGLLLLSNDKGMVERLTVDSKVQEFRDRVEAAESRIREYEGEQQRINWA